MTCVAQVLVLALLICVTGCQQKNQQLEAGLAEFSKAKEAQAKQLVSDGNLEMPSEGWKLFAAIRSDNFASAAKCFSQLEARHSAGPNALERAKTTISEKFG